MYLLLSLWFAVGGAGALIHMFLVFHAKKDGILDDDEAEWLIYMTPAAVVFGPLTVVYMVWAYFQEDEE